MFPALLVIVLGAAIPGFREPSDDLGGRRPIDIYLPIVLALAIATVTMVSLLNVLAAYRERGVLRRLSTTPVSPSTLLVAQLVVNMGALVVGAALAYAAGYLVFDVVPPRNVVGAAARLRARLGRDVRGRAVHRGGRPERPGLGRPRIAGLLPDDVLRRGVDARARRCRRWRGGSPTSPPWAPPRRRCRTAWAGGWPRPLHLAVMAAMTAGFGAAATKLFRWS